MSSIQELFKEVKSTMPNLEEIQKLLEQGINLEEVDENGNTPLLLAAIHNNKEVVDLLINNGANIRHQNHNGDNVYKILLSYEKN